MSSLEQSLNDGEIERLIEDAREHIVQQGIQVQLGQTSMHNMDEAVAYVKDLLRLTQGGCVSSDEAIKQFTADRDQAVVEVALLCYIIDQLSQ